METLIAALVITVPILLLVSGIMLIRTRKESKKNLWFGIGCLVLFVCSLPIFIPALFLVLILITGGSFT